MKSGATDAAANDARRVFPRVAGTIRGNITIQTQVHEIPVTSSSIAAG
jgi:hypothetical protein